MSLNPERVAALLNDDEVMDVALMVVTCGLGDVPLAASAWPALLDRDADWLTACVLSACSVAIGATRMAGTALRVDPLELLQALAVRRAADG